MANLEVFQQRLLAPLKHSDIQFLTGFGGIRAYTEVYPVIKRLQRVFGFHNVSITNGDIQMTSSIYDATVTIPGQKEKATVQKPGIATVVSVKLDIRLDALGDDYKGQYVSFEDVGESDGASGKGGSPQATTALAQALKRAAAKVGVGRYLWCLPYQLSSAELSESDAVAALTGAGFEFKCEVTGKEVSYVEAYVSMEKFGRVLCKEGAKSLQ